MGWHGFILGHSIFAEEGPEAVTDERVKLLVQRPHLVPDDLLMNKIESVVDQIVKLSYFLSRLGIVLLLLSR